MNSDHEVHYIRDTIECYKCHFLAGEIAGMAAALLTHPLDTIKCRMQVEMINNSIRRTHNTFGILYNVMLKDGIHNMYKGILFPFFGHGVMSAVVFGVNNVSRKVIHRRRHTKRLSLSDTAICGAFTGFCNSFLITPIERIKIWSQSHKLYSINVAQSLYKQMGIKKGYFGGFKFAAYFQIFTYSVYFPIYELSLSGLSMKKDKINNKWLCDYKIGDMTKDSKKDIPSWRIFVSGGIAGVISWIIGYPLDTLKTRVQSGFYTDRLSVESLRRHYSVGYYGMMPAIYRAALLHSSLFLMYEKALTAANKYNQIYLM